MNENLHTDKRAETPSLLIFEGVVFDNYEDKETDLDGTVWSRICSKCVEKHHIRKTLLDDSGSGSCGVKGCSNKADYYIDFLPSENVKIVKT